MNSTDAHAGAWETRSWLCGYAGVAVAALVGLLVPVAIFRVFVRTPRKNAGGDATQTEHSPQGWLVRYPIDWLSIAVVVLAVAEQAIAFKQGWAWYYFFLHVYFMRLAHLVEHNHSHVGIFHSPVLNELFGLLLMVNTGMPMEWYRVHHVKNHHVHNGTEKDWSSPFNYMGCKFPDRPVNRLYYTFTQFPISLAFVILKVIHNPKSHHGLMYVYQSSIILAFMIAVMSVDMWRFAWCYGLVWLSSYVGLAVAGWRDHVGCTFSNEFEAANNNLSFTSKLMGFNIGYHTAHHKEPSLHWSLLPQLHREMEPCIPPKYVTHKMEVHFYTTLAVVAVGMYKLIEFLHVELHLF